MHDPSQRPRALLLDLDDTILDDRSGIAGGWDLVTQLVVEAHPGLAPPDVRAEIHRVTDWFWADDARHRWGRVDLPRAREEVVGRVLEALGRPDAPLARVCSRRYAEYREASHRVAEGALEALAALREVTPLLAVVTNGAAEPQRAKLERFDLLRYFDHVQIEGEFGAGKPDRVVFEHVVERLGIDPAEGMMVGDNYECDVLGPLEVGLEAVWIEPTGEKPAPRAAPRPHARVRSLEELARRLGA